MSIVIAREMGARRMESYALSYLARAQIYQGDVACATTTFAEALTLFREISDRWGEADCNWLFGLALAQREERAQALPLLRAALAYEQEIGHAKAAEHATFVARLEREGELLRRAVNNGAVTS
jgi:tetratricopeptide (TPR) repeat protein